MNFLSNKKLINTTTTPPPLLPLLPLQKKNTNKPLQKKSNTNENRMKCQIKIEWILVREPHDNWTGAGTQIDSAPNWNYFQVFIGALFFNQSNEKIQSRNLFKNQHALWFYSKAFYYLRFSYWTTLIVLLDYMFWYPNCLNGSKTHRYCIF